MRLFARWCMILLVLIGFCLTGCGRLETGDVLIEEPPPEQITIRFLNSWGGFDSNAEALKTIFQDFMDANPDIVIINDARFGDDFLPKLKTDFATGNAPDVFGIWPGSDMAALVEAGKAADLTDMLNEDPAWKQNFNSSAWSYTIFNGRIYGLPVEIIYEALFVNTALFNEYGVPIPETYEQLKEAVGIFRENSITPIAYNSNPEGTYIYQNIAARLGGRQGVEAVDDCYVRAMRIMKELYDLGAFPRNAYSLSDRERNDLFLRQDAAMIVQGSWFTSDLYNAQLEDSVKIIPFPSFDGGDTGYPLVYGLGCGTFFMSSQAGRDAQKRDASLRLLKALTSPEASLILTSNSGFISNIDLSDYRDETNDLYDVGVGLINHAAELVPPPDSIVDRIVWEQTIVPGFPEIFQKGEIGIQQVWQRAVVEMEQAR